MNVAIDCTQVIIRKATMDDAQGMMLVNESELPENYPLDVWQSVLFDPQHASFVACNEKGDIIGYILTTVEFSFLSFTREAHVASFAVLNMYRGRGIGSRLMEASLDVVKSERKIHTCHLNVRIDNDDAKRLYERHGFVVVNTKKGYYSDDTDAYIMRSYLR